MPDSVTANAPDQTAHEGRTALCCAIETTSARVSVTAGSVVSGSGWEGDGGMSRRDEHGTAVIVRPVGSIDADTCWELRQELADAFAGGFRSIIVDLAAVEAMDVVALQVLVGARAFLLARGGVLLVTSVRPKVLSLIRLNELTELLEVPASGPQSEEEVRPVTRLRPNRRVRSAADPAVGGQRPISVLTPKTSTGA